MSKTSPLLEIVNDVCGFHWALGSVGVIPVIQDSGPILPRKAHWLKNIEVFVSLKSEMFRPKKKLEIGDVEI